MVKHKPEVLGTTSPDKIDMTLEEEYQELDVEIKPSREEIIARYHVIFILYAYY
jgi:hypothetical protein